MSKEIINLKSLPEPYIAMWDAENEGKEKILYMVLIGEHHHDKRPPQNKWRRVYSTNETHWIESTSYIRKATAQEMIENRGTIDYLLRKYKNRNNGK